MFINVTAVQNNLYNGRFGSDCMVSVILWNVENPGNVGAIARLCANFEAKELCLIEPRCNPLDQVARNRAKHAQHILDQSRILTKDDLKNFDLVIGTTAQIGTDFNLHRSSIAPDKMCELLKDRTNVALVFGSESHGLSNAQLEHCDAVVHVPSNKEYPTLNLSHAVAVLLSTLYASTATPMHEPVGRAELEKMFEFLDSIIDATDFTTEDKRQTQRQVWRKVLSKSNMTRREAFAILGLLSKLVPE